MKYKVGDKVRVRKDLEQRIYRMNNSPVCWAAVGGMLYWKGKIVTIESATSEGYRIEEHSCWWTDEMFERKESCKKIVITTDGTETLARLYEGDKVVKSATAKCSPDDEFDFSIGAKLALDRLMNTIEVGDTVVIINKGQSYTTYADWFEQNAPDLAVFYGYNYLAKNGTVGTVVRIAPHTYDKSETLYAIQEKDGVIRLINEKGIKKVEG